MQKQYRQSTILPQPKLRKRHFESHRCERPSDRPKEFSGKEEDFQQWSTEAFFAGVIKESEMMLEWAAEQTTEITTELINREVLPTATNKGARSTKPGVCSAADAYSSYGSHELRGERHCCQLAEEPIGGMAEAAEEISILQQEEGREAFFARSFLSLGRCSLLELQAGVERWESYVSRYEQKLKN